MNVSRAHSKYIKGQLQKATTGGSMLSGQEQNQLNATTLGAASQAVGQSQAMTNRLLQAQGDAPVMTGAFGQGLLDQSKAGTDAAIKAQAEANRQAAEIQNVRQQQAIAGAVQLRDINRQKVQMGLDYSVNAANAAANVKSAFAGKVPA